MGDIIIQAAIFALLSSIYIASGLRILTAKRPFIIRLAAEIDVFFRNAPTRINRRFGYALVVIGVVVLLFGAWLTYERLSLEAGMRSTRQAHQNFFKSSEK